MNKNTTKGFIMPLVVLIIAILILISASAYIYKQDAVTVPPPAVVSTSVVNNPPPTQGPVGSLKLYVPKSSYAATDDIDVTIIPNLNSATYKGVKTLSLSLVNEEGKVIHTINTTWPQAGIRADAEATSSVTFSLLSLPNYADIESGEYRITGTVAGDVLKVIDASFTLNASTVYRFVPIRSIGIYSLNNFESYKKGTSEVYRIGYGLDGATTEQFSVEVEDAVSLQSAKTSFQTYFDLPQPSYKFERVNTGSHVVDSYTHAGLQSLFWKSSNYVIVIRGYKAGADMNAAVEEYLKRFPIK